MHYKNHKSCNDVSVLEKPRSMMCRFAEVLYCTLLPYPNSRDLVPIQNFTYDACMYVSMPCTHGVEALVSSPQTAGKKLKLSSTPDNFICARPYFCFDGDIVADAHPPACPPVCVRACVRACLRACVRTCVRACPPTISFHTLPGNSW